MALKIYPDAGYSSAYSEDSAFTNPLLLAFDGVVGGVTQQRLYVGNDLSAGTYSYTSIQVTATDTDSVDLVGGTEEYSWKLFAGDTQPTEAAWAAISAGNTISLSNMPADSSTYLPFWVRIETPRGVSVQSFDTVKMNITATQSV